MDAPNTVASQYALCEASFIKLLQNLENVDDPAVARRIPDEFGRFRVWAAYAGADQTGRASLDCRLQDASHIYTKLTQFLEELNKDLEEGISSLQVNGSNLHNTGFQALGLGDSPPQVSFNDLFEPEDRLNNQGEDLSTLEALVSDIAHIITCLNKLSITIQNPVPKDRLYKIACIDVSRYEHSDIEHVEQNFCPKDPQNNFRVEKYLSDRLGKANTKRRQLLKYYESNAFERNTLANAPKLVKSTVEDDNATVKVKPVDIERDEYRSSQPSPTNDEIRVHVPSPSAENAAFEGNPFKCPYCFTIIKVKGRPDWEYVGMCARNFMIC